MYLVHVAENWDLTFLQMGESLFVLGCPRITRIVSVTHTLGANFEGDFLDKRGECIFNPQKISLFQNPSVLYPCR